MSKLMSVLGIVMLAVGAALALVGIVNPAQMDIYGLKLDTAAILFTGGVLAIGLGGLIAAVQETAGARASLPVEQVVVPADVVPASVQAPVVAESPVVPAEEPASRVRFNPFGRKAAEVAGAAGAVATGTAVVVEKAKDAASGAAASPSSGVDDTLAALEQAKADIANAIGGMASVTAPAEAAAGEDDADVASDDDGELYVVEERDIRGRPARILSDDTVEAETDEGWMRFENLEHLNEYLDSMGETA